MMSQPVSWTRETLTYCQQCRFVNTVEVENLIFRYQWIEVASLRVRIYMWWSSPRPDTTGHQWACFVLLVSGSLTVYSSSLCIVQASWGLLSHFETVLIRGPSPVVLGGYWVKSCWWDPNHQPLSQQSETIHASKLRTFSSPYSDKLI